MKVWRGTVWLPEGRRGTFIMLACSLFIREKNLDGSYEVDLDDDKLNLLDNFWGEAIWSLTSLEVS